jgi:hypothetical protein
MCKLQVGILFLALTFCGTLDIESGKIRKEGRKIVNVDLVDMYSVGTVKYCFVLWSF